MLNVIRLRHRALTLLVGAIVGLALAACQPKPVEGQSQVVENLRLDYGVTDSSVTAAHPPDHVEAQMHGGAAWGTDHITLSVFDTKTNTRIDDATVMLNLQGPGHPGHNTMPLEPMTVNGDTTYGGYVSLRHPGRYRLTFHVARAGRQHDPVKAVFAYVRPQ
jgi:hypothetical protein